MWLTSPNINCTHGFSTRHGGVSENQFATLNLGGNDDNELTILKNREIALRQLNIDSRQLCYLKQVHGNEVKNAVIGRQEGDALVSNQPNKILAISIADCYPLLFYDEVNRVIGAAHAGWRGTVARIAGKTIHTMQKLGARPETIKVAIGQGISKEKFNVGSEVIAAFEKEGFPREYLEGGKIDLVKCNIFVLQENNIPENNIWSMNRCTFETDFFSYRRDKGLTGRMWAVITMT
jgi:polyphenol oxidase